MSFLNKLREASQKLMVGRHGVDELSLALLILGVLLNILGNLIRFGLLSLLSLACYGYALFRIFSKNHEKRYLENQRYMSLIHGSDSEIRQFFVRLKYIRKFKYFKCPECHARLRLPRNVGEVTVTCGKCHHAFKQKA